MGYSYGECAEHVGSIAGAAAHGGATLVISHSETLEPLVDSLGRWQWPDPDCECVRMMRRAGRLRVVLTTWLEQQIEALVDFPMT